MLKKKLLRTIKLYKAQFISMLLMVFIGVFVFAGINAEAYGMRKYSDEYYRNNNFADSWILSQNFTKDEEQVLFNSTDIFETERRLQFESAVNNTDKKLEINFVEKNLISVSTVTEGEKFNIDSDGLWLSDLFAEPNGFKVGDSVSFKYGGNSITKQIKGLIKNPEYIYNVADDTQLIPDYASYGYAFLSYKALPEESLVFNQLLIKHNSLSKEQLYSLTVDKLGEKPVIIMTRNEQASYAMFKSEIDGNIRMAAIFPIVFLLIAVLTMITTMTRITTNEKMQIGTLKALGFRKSKILLHYSSLGLIIGVLGSVLGLIAGPLLLGNFFLSFQKTTYDMPSWGNYLPLYSYFIIIGMTVLLTAITFLSCKKMLGGTAAESLRPVTPKKPKKTVLEKTKSWKKFSFNVKWNLRDITRNKIRSLITIIGVVGSMMLMLCAFAMSDSMSDVTKWMYEDMNNYSYKVNLEDNVTAAAAQTLSESLNGGMYSETAIEIKTDEGLKTQRLEMYGSQEFVTFNDYKRNEITLNDSGIYITYKLANTLNIKTEDKISLRLYGSDSFTTVKVAGIIRSPLNQGFVMTYSAAQSYGLNYATTAILTNKEVTAEYSEFIKTVQSVEELKKSMNIMLESLNAIIFIMILGAVILSIVVLYNLGILSYNERFRELSTLKVMGFNNKKINRLTISQNIWLTAAGIIFGIPSGIMLAKFMMTAMTDSMDIMISISALSYAVCIVTVFLVSFIVNLVLFKKTKKIDMVSALKSGE